jgi:hypothetical protein
MAGKPTNTALQAEVAAAVSAAPDGTPRGVIVRQFLNRGVSRASLYVWVERAMTGLAMNRLKGTHSPPIETDARVIRGLSGITKRDRASAPIRFLDILHRTIADLEALRAMAVSEDGKIRNVRLMLETADKIGRTLDRAARIGVIIRDIEADRAFMRDLADVIHRLPPHVGEPILAEMRELGHGAML